MLWQVSLPQGSAAKVGDWSGWKVGAGKQALQGAHCDHTSGLVMSRIPEMFCGEARVYPYFSACFFLAETVFFSQQIS
jgi:hypothetical protein